MACPQLRAGLEQSQLSAHAGAPILQLSILTAELSLNTLNIGTKDKEEK